MSDWAVVFITAIKPISERTLIDARAHADEAGRGTDDLIRRINIVIQDSKQDAPNGHLLCLDQPAKVYATRKKAP